VVQHGRISVFPVSRPHCASRTASHSPKLGNPSPLQVAMDYCSILMGTQKTGNRGGFSGLFIPRGDQQGLSSPFSVRTGTHVIFPSVFTSVGVQGQRQAMGVTRFRSAGRDGRVQNIPAPSVPAGSAVAMYPLREHIANDARQLPQSSAGHRDRHQCTS